MNKPILFGAVAAGALFLMPVSGGGLYAGPTLGIPAAQAQNIQNQPWGFSARNKSMAAQYQYQDRVLSNSSGSSSGGLGALQQYVTTYNSSSTAIGNLTEVNQNLSGGSSGTVGATQDSQGSQGADAATDVTQTNTNTNSNNTNSSTNADQGEETQTSETNSSTSNATN